MITLMAIALILNFFKIRKHEIHGNTNYYTEKGSS